MTKSYIPNPLLNEPATLHCAIDTNPCYFSSISLVPVAGMPLPMLNHLVLKLQHLL